MQKIILPKFIGHRGASGIAPENTISSIVKAKSLGLEFIEVDVKISKDKVPILLHDDTLDRTTNGSGLCCDFNFDELLKLDAGNWFNKNFRNEKILSLEKCIDFVCKNQMGINIELKPNQGKEKENVISIEKLFKIKKDIKKCFFSSFDILSLKYSSDIFPKIPRGYLVNENINMSLNDIVDICSKYNCFSLGLSINFLNNDMIKFFKKNNLIITVFSVNEINFAKNIFDWGVDSIFTDRPDIVFF